MMLTLKRCSICKVEKDTKEFNRSSRRKDGLQPHCRVCSRIRFQKYYLSNLDKHRKICTDKKKATIARNKEKVLEYLRSHPCVDCGESDEVVLEFDHVRGEKDREVTKMILSGCGWSRIEKEIAKCDVRCANCHRRKTQREQNSYRLGS